MSPPPTKLSPAGIQAIQAHTFADVWAQTLQLKVDGRSWNLDSREYLREVYRDNSEHVVALKAAQMGFTVCFLVKTLHRVIEWKLNVLYLMPTKVGVVPFVQGRFNPMIDENALIKKRFEKLDSITHKRTNHNNLYFRGTTVVTDLREIPVDMEIWDERDKMVAANLPLALTRMDGSEIGHLAELSTPTIENWGVDAVYKDSDQRQWWIKCPFCNADQHLMWDTNVQIGDTTDLDRCKETTFVFCSACKKKLEHHHIMEAAQKGHWVAQYPTKKVHGYYINQLVSPTRQIGQLAEIWYKGEIRGDVDQSRELWNSALGLPWTAPGDKLHPEDLDKCVREGYHMPTIEHSDNLRPISIGVDVGKYLHVVALDGNDEVDKRVLDIRLEDWDGLTALCKFLERRRYYWTMVMDANPEKHMAEKLAAAYPMKIWLAYYRDPKHMSDLAVFNPPDMAKGRRYCTVHIDRTMAIDTAHEVVFKNRLILPANARRLVQPGADNMGDFYHQMTAQTAITQPDGMGNPRRVYVQPQGRADHFDHAYTYANTATLLEPMINPAPPAMGLQDTREGQEILDETESLFTQDHDGMDFDGYFYD